MVDSWSAFGITARAIKVMKRKSKYSGGEHKCGKKEVRVSTGAAELKRALKAWDKKQAQKR